MSRYALLALVACSSRATPRDEVRAPPAQLVDAGPRPGISEDTRRAGKRTGLGSPTERPEVATQAFVGAMLSGAQPWSRVVDPRRGVFELRNIDADRRPVAATADWQCGAAIDQALARLSAAAAARPGDEQLGYKFACINDPLDEVPPSAGCAIYSSAEGAVGFSLVFTPDPALGLRLTAIMMGDERSIPGDLQQRFDEQSERPDPHCP